MQGLFEQVPASNYSMVNLDRIMIRQRKTIFLLSVYKPLLAIMLLLFGVNLQAGVTGKIAGKVLDDKTGEPVIGANVVLEGTYLGAAADIDGYYAISNIPPGKYRLVISAIGYQKVTIENILVKIDLTTTVDVKLTSSTLMLDKEVVITSERPLVQKDLTSTSTTISSDDIKLMPVENVGQIVNLQAGVMDGHFRGGRSNDVAYLIDGVAVTDPFNGGFTMEVENTSIRQMEVITGTFNAEYGQALSGVVNIVTEGGSNKFRMNVSSYLGNFITNSTDLFRNLDRVDRISQRSIQVTLSGPVAPVNNLYFFTTGRYASNTGHLYGKRVYNVTDDVPFFPNQANKQFWIPRNTGDNAYVAMNPSEKYSFNGKLTYALPKIAITYSLFWDRTENRYYDHGFSWTPDGIMTHYGNDLIQNLQFIHDISSSTNQSLKFSFSDYDFKGYLYEDKFDPRYVNPRQGISLSNYTFRSGGNQGGRYHRYTKTMVGQWALSSQINKEHKIGMGVEARFNTIYNQSMDMVNLTDGQTDSLGNVLFTPGYPAKGTISDQGSHIEYTRYPLEASAYIQDKMEYDIMIINAGLRFDYFNSNASMPADKKNPTRNSDFNGADQWVEATDNLQLSPRLGASFPITDKGIIRFSYGHFFKIPAFENLYQNPDFIVRPGNSLNSIIGNPDLKAEKNVIYEIGLQQVLFEDVSLNASLYYRDIRNWLGMEIVNTYEGFKYARFINRDYANVRGLVLVLDKRFSNFFSAKLDYTYQIAEGNSSDPYAVYNKNQTVPPIEEAKSVVPLDWDQRHTMKLVVNIGLPADWTGGLIFQYGSGTPYTEDPRISRGVRFENGGIKPTFFNMDLRADKAFDIGSGLFLRTYIMIYNVLDLRNEFGVYSSTGRANIDLNTQTAGDVIGLNTIEEYIKNPSMYSAPREIRVGVGIDF